MTIVNHRDTLYFENAKYFNRENAAVLPLNEDCVRKIFPLLPQKIIQSYFGLNQYQPKAGSSEGKTNEFWDFRQSYSLGFYFNTPNIYGMPERVDTFKIQVTD